MQIKKLPQYLINKLKAGEIVERPASVVKELIENSLDAGAQNIVLSIDQGGKQKIIIEDDGVGMDENDLGLSIERYATSKIKDEQDLNNLSMYGFRGEALASISEISKFTIQTKTLDQQFGYQLIKTDQNTYNQKIPFKKDHGSIVYVEDIFFNTPARQKFLKTNQTERNYIYNIFLDYALVNYQVGFKLSKDQKIFMDLKPADSNLQRIFDIYKKEREKNINIVENKDQKMQLYGIVSDSGISFLKPDHIKIFVNKRPVNDKIIKKAILKAYERQLPYGEYPLVTLFLDISPDLIDVNVHPRKLEIKFLDPGNVFNFVEISIKEIFSQNKISATKLDQGQKKYKFSQYKQNQNGFEFEFKKSVTTQQQPEIENIVEENTYFKIIGQLRDSYILLESDDDFYLVDQHAIAERIAFEKLKTQLQNQQYSPSILLNPLKINLSKNIQIDQKIDQLNNLGFDIGMIGENKLAIYALPKPLADNKIDLEKCFDKILENDEINISLLLDNIFATKACKSSIKAGQKLSHLEMENLIKDGFDIISGMFVCQHGRPGFVKLDKEQINKLFDR